MPPWGRVLYVFEVLPVKRDMREPLAPGIDGCQIDFNIFRNSSNSGR